MEVDSEQNAIYDGYMLKAMSVRYILLFVILTTSFLFAGCPNPTDDSTSDDQDTQTAKEPVVLKHQNSQWGDPIPPWVQAEATDLEDQTDYEGDYVFLIDCPEASTLDGVATNNTEMDPMVKVAEHSCTRVEDLFSGDSETLQNNVRTFLDKVENELAAANLSELRKQKEFWLLYRFYNDDGSVDRDAYLVRNLYTIPESTLNTLMNDTVDGTSATTDEEEAKTEIQSRIANGF